MSEIKDAKTLEEIQKRDEHLIKKGVIRRCGRGTIDSTVILDVVKNQFFVGEGSSIGYGCRLTGIIKIGKYTMLGYNVMVLSEEHVFWNTPEKLFMTQGAVYKPIVIGDDVWIGAYSVITGGVVIGDHAIIGAGAIVTHDVPEWEIWAGNPAKKIGDRRTWHKSGDKI